MFILSKGDNKLFSLFPCKPYISDVIPNNDTLFRINPAESILANQTTSLSLYRGGRQPR